MTKPDKELCGDEASHKELCGDEASQGVKESCDDEASEGVLPRPSQPANIQAAGLAEFEWILWFSACGIGFLSCEWKLGRTRKG